MRSLLPVLLLLSIAAPSTSSPAGARARLHEGGEELRSLQAAASRRYAELAHRLYARCAVQARELRAAIGTLVETPTPETLAAARRVWIAGRDEYGKTEVLRFYGGPIDDPRVGVETLLNAWPLDEAYIDAVAGAPDAGIIGDPEGHPNLSATLLTLLNERGGEANVCVGWHAIEFLLWGQDLDPDGPGRRSHEDYVVGVGRHAARRAEYLSICAELLVEHLETVRDAWAPDAGDYRAAFLAAPPEESFRKILAGMTILSGFELAGERLAVAYETRDQEQEHSCFSDNTRADFVADQLGILAVFRGEREDDGPLVREVARAVDPALADALERRLQETLALLRALPQPFDRALIAEDGAPEREALLAALVSLERQAELLAALGVRLGHDIALRPGG